LNVAVTDCALDNVTEHAPVPVHAPLHPPNVLDASGVALKLIEVPLLNCDEHVLPQLIPVGFDVTVPPPVPAFTTVKVFVGN
jgi:hypothetical protein